MTTEHRAKLLEHGLQLATTCDGLAELEKKGGMPHILSLYLVRDTRGRGIDRVTLAIQPAPLTQNQKCFTSSACLRARPPHSRCAWLRAPNRGMSVSITKRRDAGERFSGRRAAARTDGVSGQWGLGDRVYARRMGGVVFLLLATGCSCGR